MREENARVVLWLSFVAIEMQRVLLSVMSNLARFDHFGNT